MSNPNQGPPPSCLNCPSFVKEEDVPRRFKKSVGAPVCLRYGHVLGRPGSTEKQQHQIATIKAKNCPSFGEPAPGAPMDYQFQVALPDPSIRPADNEQDRNAVASCNMCVNFVPDRVVAQELGWTSGACAAKGKLILLPRLAAEAKGCELRNFGRVRTSTSGMMLLPEYEDTFNLNSDPVKAYFKSQKTEAVEPGDWPTDKEVSAEDRAAGIKAWRKFMDPAGSGNEAYLPVFDEAIFSEEERVKIPRSGDDEHPELYIDHFGGMYMLAVTWQELDETPALWGPAGVGKTELFRAAAWMMCLPFERISITGQTEIDDLAGKMMFSKDKGTYFKHGRLPQAWAKPCVVCIDEPNVAEDPAVWHFIRPLTDNSKQMVLDMNEGERITRNVHCYPGMAMNPAWDVRNVGAQEIGDADVNRLFHIFIELPPPELEREIIRHRVELDGWELDDKRLDRLMAVAADLRALIDEGTVPISWGIRPQIKVARALRWFEPITAYRRAVTDYLEPQASTAILDIVRTQFA